MRTDGRAPKELRKVSIERGFVKQAEGSVLITMGGTRVVCNASVVEGVPPFLKGTGKGWITAEYGMLPRSTSTRMTRESSAGKVGGRTHEIQRLIGRALRSVVNMNVLGERTIWVDCDVIEAEGGTRTASITGGFVALVEALHWLKAGGILSQSPVRDTVAAISVGICNQTVLLDLNYTEDSTAEVDANLVMTGSGKIVEVQGTAERQPFSKEQWDQMLELSVLGIRELTRIQKEALGDLLKFTTSKG
ncbi:MAG: ribonuclease PH [Deltaproteobacteria bacterium]|nr:ribonuclease PH [Deltaproteobacteria bacterium]